MAVLFSSPRTPTTPHHTPRFSTIDSSSSVDTALFEWGVVKGDFRNAGRYAIVGPKRSEAERGEVATTASAWKHGGGERGKQGCSERGMGERRRRAGGLGIAGTFWQGQMGMGSDPPIVGRLGPPAKDLLGRPDEDCLQVIWKTSSVIRFSWCHALHARALYAIKPWGGGHV